MAESPPCRIPSSPSNHCSAIPSLCHRPAMNKIRFALLSLTAVAALGLAGWKLAASPAEQMQTFAVAFVETLTPDQKANAVMAFDSPKRVGWHFIPMKERKGLMLEQMNDAQRTAALRLLRSALSEAGYSKANRIMLLEEVLNEMEAGKGAWERNPQRYYVTLFGDVTEKGEDASWGLSFEGHHLSLNFVCRGGKVVDSTPQFMATNPAVVKNETSVTLGKGTAVLNQEEQLAFKLVKSLDSKQLKVALIAEEALAEIRFAGEPQPTVGEPEGIAYSSLNPDQQKQLRDVVDLYVSVAPEKVAAERTQQIETDGWNNVHFAWAGALEPGIGHYYRVRGKRFLIEFVNTQADPAGNPANHIHCVYRDLSGDFDLPIAP
ncbi:secreted protein [Rhodopirellula islandica]|uniref:Secreted protein n=2 Tax=Rhodopirellula islandica TaxID=595434 RepID=A0A0J1BH20_RHOIS|nr:secreted protein [Rhodopirellula islandica]